MIDCLWPIPIYKEIVDFDLNKKEIDKIEFQANSSRNFKKKKRELEKLSVNSISKNTYILDTYFSGLKEGILFHINAYINEWWPPRNKNLEFIITQSWITQTHKNQFHHSHRHGNSFLSGVFYIQTQDDDYIVFKDPLWKLKNTISFDTKTQNVHIAENINFFVEDNCVILFPAWLEHGVDAQEDIQKPRISLAFNVWMKGEIGHEERALDKLFL